MKDRPLVSVLMSVFNDEMYLNSTIESVLSQSYKNFEFIIINDGSTDKSEDIIKSYPDDRIKYFKNENNIGLTSSLIKGFNLAKGRYLARIDSNDVCYSERFEKQVDFLLLNPQISVCGSSCYAFGDLVIHRKIKYPERHELICCQLLFNSPIAHVAAMIDLDKFRENDLNYNAEYKAAQDYDLWYRASKKVKLANIPECLVKIRYLKTGISMAGVKTKQSTFASRIRKRILEDLNINFTEEEFEIHNLICKHQNDGTPDFNKRAFEWLKKIQQHNICKGTFEPKYLILTLDFYWFMLCKYSGCGIKYYNDYTRNSIDPFTKVPLKKKIELLWACLFRNFIRSIIR